MFTNWIIVFWGNWASIAICAYVLAYQGQVKFCISCFITSWRAPFYTHGFILWSTSSHQHHDLYHINIILLAHLLSTSSLTSHSHFLSTQLYATDPWLTWLQSLAMHKVEYGWSVVVCRAIGANWMVCCAVCMSIASQVMRCMIACMIWPHEWLQELLYDLWCWFHHTPTYLPPPLILYNVSNVCQDQLSRTVSCFLPVFLFALVGFEHCIANQFYVSLALMYGCNSTVGEFISQNLIPAAIGNFIGD